MSEEFFKRFTELLFRVIIIILLFLSTIMVLLAWISTQNVIFYYGYIGALAFCFVYVVQYARQFKDFKETVAQGLLIPSDVAKSVDPEHLDIPEDKALAVCAYYHNGASLNQIAESMNLKEPQQVKRYLIKGLDVLLKSYNERNGKEVIPA